MKLDWQDFGLDVDGEKVWEGWRDADCYVVTVKQCQGGWNWRVTRDTTETSKRLGKGVAKSEGAALGAGKRCSEADAKKRAKKGGDR